MRPYVLEVNFAAAYGELGILVPSAESDSSNDPVKIIRLHPTSVADVNKFTVVNALSRKVVGTNSIDLSPSTWLARCRIMSGCTSCIILSTSKESLRSHLHQ